MKTLLNSYVYFRPIIIRQVFQLSINHNRREAISSDIFNIQKLATNVLIKPSIKSKLRIIMKVVSLDNTHTSSLCIHQLYNAKISPRSNWLAAKNSVQNK